MLYMTRAIQHVSLETITMAVTRRDIADRLNLSHSLVSGALNNKAGVRASEETRKIILRAAREMNYQPHAAASALRRGKTNVVACIFIGPTGTQAVIENIAACLGEIGYDVPARVLQRPEQTASALESLLFSGKCDAGILWGAEAEKASGLPPREDYIFLVGNDAEGIYAQMARWMSLPPDERPDAIVSGSGLGTWIAIRPVS